MAMNTATPSTMPDSVSAQRRTCRRRYGQLSSPNSLILPIVRSETVAECQAGVGVEAVLADEIVRLASNQRGVHRRPPVPEGSLRKFTLEVGAVAVLAHGGFEGEAAVDVDRVRGAADERARQASIR